MERSRSLEVRWIAVMPLPCRTDQTGHAGGSQPIQGWSRARVSPATRTLSVGAADARGLVQDQATDCPSPERKRRVDGPSLTLRARIEGLGQDVLCGGTSARPRPRTDSSCFRNAHLALRGRSQCSTWNICLVLCWSSECSVAPNTTREARPVRTRDPRRLLRQGRPVESRLRAEARRRRSRRGTSEEGCSARAGRGGGPGDRELPERPAKCRSPRPHRFPGGPGLLRRLQHRRHPGPAGARRDPGAQGPHRPRGCGCKSRTRSGPAAARLQPGRGACSAFVAASFRVFPRPSYRASQTGGTGLALSRRPRPPLAACCRGSLPNRGRSLPGSSGVIPPRSSPALPGFSWLRLPLQGS